MKQIYHPYTLWEDWKAGMWRKESKEYEIANLPAIIRFTGNHKSYGKYMNLVVNKWFYSCEHNLSNPSINKKAWLGHAACALYKSYPEYLVRQAWGHLTDKQRDLANQQAHNAIETWKKKYENISERGKIDVTIRAFQIMHPKIWNGMHLFRLTDE